MKKKSVVFRAINSIVKNKFPVSIIYLFMGGYLNFLSQNVRHVEYYHLFIPNLYFGGKLIQIWVKT